MAKFFVVHTLKKSAEEFTAMFNEQAPEMARMVGAGETPAKCIKTWNPIPHGRTDCVFCLWEADKAEDVDASLAAVRDYLTADIMQVAELDWAELAAAGA